MATMRCNIQCQFATPLQARSVRPRPLSLNTRRPLAVTQAQQRAGVGAAALQLLSLASILAVPAALAEESSSYDPSGGSDVIKSASGVAYVGLVGFFLYRLLTRRAKKAREERIASTPSPPPPQSTAAASEDNKQVTPLNTFIGAAQAGVLGFGMWIFTTKVQGAMDVMSMPSGYTAQNISITVRTIIAGLSYLATFIFVMNCVGLSALTVQLLLFPDSMDQDSASPRVPSNEPQLPKVGITASADEIRRAFDIAEQQGIKQGEARKER